MVLIARSIKIRFAQKAGLPVKDGHAFLPYKECCRDDTRTYFNYESPGGEVTTP